jgi:hypothetical protein
MYRGDEATINGEVYQFDFMGRKGDNACMDRSRFRTLCRIQVIGLIVVLLQACGVKGTTTTCGTNVAQFTVTDNFIRRDCGCTEAGATSFTGQTLVCTLPVGTRLYIYYSNIDNAHQLTFGSTAIGTLSYHDPASDGDHNPTDAITLNATSAGITFVDSATGNGGTLIVQ